MLLCSRVWLLAGVAHRGVTSPEDAVPILTLACPACSVLASLHVVCFWSMCLYFCSVVNAGRCQPPHGWLACCWPCRAAAGISVVVWVGRGSR